jgi:hypothetical protein
MELVTVWSPMVMVAISAGVLAGLAVLENMFEIVDVSLEGD